MLRCRIDQQNAFCLGNSVEKCRFYKYPSDIFKLSVLISDPDSVLGFTETGDVFDVLTLNPPRTYSDITRLHVRICFKNDVSLAVS